MALRALMLRRSIDNKKKELEQLRGKEAAFKKRETELEAAIAEVTEATDEEQQKAVEEEVMNGEAAFRRKKIFNFMIKYLCPVFAAIILLSSVANAFGWIKM